MGRERITPVQNPRICPKCGKIYPWGRMRCNGTGKNHCDTPTIPYVEPVSEPKPKPKAKKK